MLFKVISRFSPVQCSLGPIAAGLWLPRHVNLRLHPFTCLTTVWLCGRCFTVVMRLVLDVQPRFLDAAGKDGAASVTLGRPNAIRILL